MENVYIGTELKFLINIEGSGFSMDDDDFTVEIVRGNQRIFFPKSELIVELDTETIDNEEVEVNRYYVCFDTAMLGVGYVYAVITAYVPDEDFPDELRTEVYKVELCKLVAA